MIQVDQYSWKEARERQLSEPMKLYGRGVLYKLFILALSYDQTHRKDINAEYYFNP